MRVQTHDGVGGEVTHVDFESQKCRVAFNNYQDRKEVPAAKLRQAGNWEDAAWEIVKVLEQDSNGKYKVEWRATLLPRSLVDKQS